MDGAHAVVGALVYLASEASDFTTGHDIVIDGGYTAWWIGTCHLYHRGMAHAWILAPALALALVAGGCALLDRDPSRATMAELLTGAYVLHRW